MTVQVEPDQATLEEFMGRVIGYLTGAAAVYGILLGDELGLYRGLVEAGPMSADALAAKVGCNPRLIREWLDGQAAAKLVRYDAVTDSYNMSPEAAMALSDDSSPVFVARGMNGFATFFLDFDKLVAAYRSNGALPWAEHHPRLFAGTEWFFRTGYRAHLTTAWLPALEGIEAKLQGGARVADIGCGHGASVIVMADSYPRSEVWGFDFHQPSIDTARERAAAAHLSDRAHFEVATAKSYPGAYDLICFFDCLHDMGDPVGIARYAREHLTPGGTVMLVEPYAVDGRAANIETNPMATALYLASSAVCTPNSLSQEVGLGIGAQAGEARLREVFQQAGYSHFRRATETPINLIFEARA
ncbi:MAG TPA: class I SAM-dependent methyltransferase [Chloroflexota bacterium]|jgi:2-polyprenyl-3-methyl-5-hydroxy-6-metoxy-1,4-benzoquinol methylase